MLILLISFGLLFQGSGQRRMSVQEALALAAQNNLTIKSAEAGELAARASHRMTSAVFLPGVSVSYTGVSTNDPLSVFGFKLKQERVGQADFDPARLNHPDARENFSTRIDIQQPLLNLDGIYARKAAKNYYEAVSLQSGYTAAQIRYEVKKAYYQLELAAMSVQVLEQSVGAAEEALKLTEQNEQQGLAKKADVLEASVRVEERQDQLRQSDDQWKAAGEHLAHLLGLELGTRIEPSDTLVEDPAPERFSADPADIGNRSDVQAWQKQLEAGEAVLKSEKMKFIPRINAFGSYEWNEHKIAGSPVNNYMVGAALKWDLFSGNQNRGSVQQAAARLEEARHQYRNYLSQSQIQLNNAQRRAALSYRQVRSKALAREQATESLRIRTNRFREGLEKTADLLATEALTSQKKLEYIQAVYQYREAVFHLELLLEKEPDHVAQAAMSE
ncbi:MAG: TolC family protein, partial [Mangrovibacterium sp.]|nr:TolC family protein [Mangrovibacterium sp.]